jgi:hypothetical protein
MNKHHSARQAITVAMAIAAIAFSAGTFAEGHRQQGGKGKPPPEAISACEDLQLDDACGFSGRRGDTVEGQCVLPPEEDNVLVCAPEHGPHSGRPDDGGERE